MTDDREQKADDRERKTDDREQKAKGIEVGRWNAASGP
jgi:hypothetical protein